MFSVDRTAGPVQIRNDSRTPMTAPTTVTTYANNMIFWAVIAFVTKFQFY